MATSFPSLYAVPQYKVHPLPGQKIGPASDVLLLRQAEGAYTQHQTVDSDPVLLPGLVDTMHIQEVGLDAHIREGSKQHRTGLRMLRCMKSELRLFVPLEPRVATV